MHLIVSGEEIEVISHKESGNKRLRGACVAESKGEFIRLG